MKQGEITFRDHRGRNPRSQDHRRKFGEANRNSVIFHVMQFPRETSHYSRRRSTGEYLSPDLNVSRLYRAFKEQNPTSIVSERYYRKIFNKYFFDLKFKRPHTDTCGTCDKFKIQREATPTDLKIITLSEQHLQKAEAARKMMYNAMAESQMPDSEVYVLSLDLQKVLFVPTLTHSKMFYSRQLAVYNLCFHIGDIGNAVMCMWHELTAGRGGNEIASCFLHVLKTRRTVKRNVQVWADNCSGQNKNRMMVFVMFYLVATEVYDEIEMNFLVSGHSFMPCDQDFAVIEKRKKLTKAMTPDDIKAVVRTAKLDHPFTVLDMEPGDFVDISAVAHEYLQTSRMKISSLSRMKVTKGSVARHCIMTKTTYREAEAWSEVHIMKKKKTVRDLPATLPPLGKKPTLDPGKRQNLYDMLEYLPEQSRKFYESIL